MWVLCLHKCIRRHVIKGANNCMVHPTHGTALPRTALADVRFSILESLIELSPTEISAPPGVWSEMRRQMMHRGVVDSRSLQGTMGKLVRRLHSVSTGSAACEPGLLDFLKTVFGEVMVFNNYGATEVGCIAVNGRLDEDLQVKLLEVPEQGIVAPRGEICIKAAGVFEGYFSSDQSQSALTEHGYYRTGDIGEKLENGEIRVVGRLANLVKLSNGKFESLEDVDQKILQVEGIQQVCTLEVCGSLAAVVYAPDLDPLPWLGVPSLRSPSGFTLENGLLTASRKLCRPAVRRAFSEELQRLVAERSEKLAQWLATFGSGESRSLRELGISSLHFAQIAASLKVPVHLVAGARSLQDLKALQSSSPS